MITGMPLIVLAFWSRAWIGPWFIMPVIVTALWLWLNPRLFPPPADDHSWVSRGVFGERLWAQRGGLPEMPIGAKLPHIYTAIAGIGVLPLIYGLIVLQPVPTVIGACVSVAGKMAFIGRMVALYDRMATRHPHLRYTPETTPLV